ncbi:hypothetical protein ACF0H5_011144 [Mactra antiquata]
MVDAFCFDEKFELTDAMKNKYEDDGFFVVKNFLDKEEVENIWKTLEEPDSIMKKGYVTHEPDGKKIMRILYSQPGNDFTGILARSEKIVNTVEELLGGEVYHYHSKFILKNAHEGGRHVWHQDYGYWYKHNVFPDMITVWMPIDKATRNNSCLQLLKGSHKCGRITHVPSSGFMQTEADPERIEQLKQVCEHLYCEMEPGDVLFQHCNLLHTSAPNDSDMRRWAFVACYNRRSNSSIVKHHHPQYSPIEKVPDSEIKKCTNFTDFSGKDFVNPIGNEDDRKLYSAYNIRKP